jgi:CRP-like cAMP-binding protein
LIVLSLQIIAEGILERGNKQEGKQDQMLAGEMFGQESLLEDKHRSEVWIKCLQPTKMLEIHQEYYTRYVRPLQLAEWDRLAALVKELPIFNEPDSPWHGNRLNRLLQSMQLKTYQAGDTVLREGDNNKELIFLMSGHCHVTKYVQDEQRKKMAAMLPSPLRSDASIAVADSNKLPDGLSIDIVTLYRGAILDAESSLELKPASFTATAMSYVEVALIDVSKWINIDNPVITCVT